MQRIQDIKKWRHVPEGTAMNFENTAERRMRLDVNAAGMALLWYVDGDGETTLLAVVTGRDVIEFATHGGMFSIEVTGADVFVYTVDGENFSFAKPDAVKFTKMIERRARNPEVEYMQYMMRENHRVMLEQQAEQFERMRAEFQRNQPAPAAQPEPSGDAAGSAGKPEPDGGAGVGAGDPPADGGDAGKAKKAK